MGNCFVYGFMTWKANAVTECPNCPSGLFFPRISCFSFLFLLRFYPFIYCSLNCRWSDIIYLCIVYLYWILDGVNLIFICLQFCLLLERNLFSPERMYSQTPICKLIGVSKKSLLAEKWFGIWIIVLLVLSYTEVTLISYHIGTFLLYYTLYWFCSILIQTRLLSFLVPIICTPTWQPSVKWLLWALIRANKPSPCIAS